MISRADELVEIVRSCGNDPRDPRDAAHEACHAIQFGVPRGKWDRETIHSHLTSPRRRMMIAEVMLGRGVAPGIGTQVYAEMIARAVEQRVCATLKVECKSIDYWAVIACEEALKNSGIKLPSPSWFADRVRDLMDGDDSVTASLTMGVLGLKVYRPRARPAA